MLRDKKRGGGKEVRERSGKEVREGRREGEEREREEKGGGREGQREDRQRGDPGGRQREGEKNWVHEIHSITINGCYPMYIP